MKRILVLTTALFINTSFGATADVLQNKLNSIRTMSAKFSQVIKAGKKVLSRSSGTMALERPGRFRWQTRDPMAQLVVADNKHLWVYDVDLEQVTVKKQEKGLGGTAALFLSGYDDNVTRNFTVSNSNEGKDELYDLQAKSGKENFQHVKLRFLGDSLTGIELDDQLGQHTVVTLSDIKNNPPLPASLFEFKPPKGVDVVQQ